MADLTLVLQLVWEFFLTGLFAVGGGLSTIPFLYEMMNKYHWFTQSDLMNMIAVSESTPGPLGVNMATYVGYAASGGQWWVGVLVTLSLVAPSVIVICIIAKLLKQFKDSHWVADAFYGLRPAVAGLIAAAGLGVFVSTVCPEGAGLTNVSWIHLALTAVFGVIAFSYKKLHPIALICICAVVGILLQL